MKVLIACEESQTVCKSFRALGHTAFSNDRIDCSGGHPEWHIKSDCEKAITMTMWDLIVFHPPCTAMAVSGNRWYGKGMIYNDKRSEAIEWTVSMWELIKNHSARAAMENPVSVLFSDARVENPQYIQPWQFGHGETKKTGLALYNLPELTPTDIVSGREQRIWKMPPGPNRARERSKTFRGIAEAMANQWGKLKNTTQTTNPML